MVQRLLGYASKHIVLLRNARKVVGMCEFSVFIKGEVVSKDVIYAKADGNRVIIRNASYFRHPVKHRMENSSLFTQPGSGASMSPKYPKALDLQPPQTYLYSHCPQWPICFDKLLVRNKFLERVMIDIRSEERWTCIWRKL